MSWVGKEREGETGRGTGNNSNNDVMSSMLRIRECRLGAMREMAVVLPVRETGVWRRRRFERVDSRFAVQRGIAAGKTGTE